MRYLTRLETLAWRMRATAALARVRVTSIEVVRNRRPKRVLVVCHGNIYRSAFAGEWLQGRFASALEVRSAGFHPEGGRPSPARHVAMSQQHGVDLSRHRSAVVTAADIEWADVILLMDRSNWVRLRRMGARTDKLAWLGAWARTGGTELNDPYHMEEQSALVLMGRMAKCLAAFRDDVIDAAGHSRQEPATGASANGEAQAVQAGDPTGSRPRSEGHDRADA